MKRLLMIIVAVLFAYTVSAQEKMYFLFEFMEVDNEQETAYMETEAFWKNIHKERLKNGDIIGWDLWELRPGGENQSYQYMTVNIYDSPVKMMTGAGDFTKALTEAYPEMSEDVLEKIIDRTGKSRNLAERLYVEYVDGTLPIYDMPLGTVASIDLMKVALDQYAEYEKAESNLFKPIHQKQVDNGTKQNWSMVRIMSPIGSDAYASHITVNMYTDYNQFFMKRENFQTGSDRETKNALALRELKYVYMATLIDKVR